jgi:hypothetical protein
LKALRVFGWIFFALALFFSINRIFDTIRASKTHEFGSGLGAAIDLWLALFFLVLSLVCLWPYARVPKTLAINIGFWMSALLIVLHVISVIIDHYYCYTC